MAGVGAKSSSSNITGAGEQAMEGAKVSMSNKDSDGETALLPIERQGVTSGEGLTLVKPPEAVQMRPSQKEVM